MVKGGNYLYPTEFDTAIKFQNNMMYFSFRDNGGCYLLVVI